MYFAESVRKMAEWSQGHFDPRVFQAFVKSIGITRSARWSSSARVAWVVTEQGRKSLLTPQVKVFFSTRSNARIRPEIIDLGSAGCPHKIVGREDPEKWRFPDLNEMWCAAPS